MEKIIITTEEVTISDLVGREKQIYDYAYNKGFNEGVGEKDMNKSRWFFGIGLWVLVGFLIFKFA